MTLELWLGLADARTIKQRVDLGGRTTLVHLDAPARIVSVAVSPRHDVLVDVRSAVTGDLDFDGETDGLDLLRCTRAVGRSYDGEAGLGLWNVHETFDARCDVDGDMRIDATDIATLAASFGTLRTP